MIGSAEMQGRLYILRVPSCQNLQIKPVKSPHITNIVNFTTSDLETLWHFRLGHVSNKSLDVIKNKFSFVKYNKSFICYICHFAKQKKFPFLLVHLNLKNVFIWFMLVCGDHTHLHQFIVINIFWPWLMIIQDTHGFLL